MKELTLMVIFFYLCTSWLGCTEGFVFVPVLPKCTRCGVSSRCVLHPCNLNDCWYKTKRVCKYPIISYDIKRSALSDVNHLPFFKLTVWGPQQWSCAICCPNVPFRWLSDPLSGFVLKPLRSVLKKDDLSIWRPIRCSSLGIDCTKTCQYIFFLYLIYFLCYLTLQATSSLKRSLYY